MAEGIYDGFFEEAFLYDHSKPRQSLQNSERVSYIALLPTLRDSASAIASTKKRNISFNDAKAAGIILATCPTEWRNQYEMNHRTVPESARAMLQDLENI